MSDRYQYTGRMVVSITGKELLPLEREIIAHPMAAGIILFTRNYSSPAQLRHLLSDIQATAIKSGKIEGLPIFVDQEGGRVQRFGTGFASPLPCPEVFGTAFNINKEFALDLAMEYGKKMAAPLMDIGVISLAPVLDLQAGNKVIEGLGRAFHKNPEACALLADAYIAGMNSVGMTATGKHFPGHGQDIGDSHETSPVDLRTLETMETQDLLPFIDLMKKNKLAAIMPAHITYPEIDPKSTAGMSEIWLSDILRKRYGFNGIVVSDCLSMKGAGSGSHLDKTLQALQNGDIALLCNLEPEVLFAALNGLDKQYTMTEEMNIRFKAWVDSTAASRLQLAKVFTIATASTSSTITTAFVASAAQNSLQGSLSVTDSEHRVRRDDCKMNIKF